MNQESVKNLLPSYIINQEGVFVVEQYITHPKLNDFLFMYELSDEQVSVAHELLKGDSEYQLIFNDELKLVYVMNPCFHSLVSVQGEDSQSLVVSEPQKYLSELSGDGVFESRVKMPLHDLIELVEEGELIGAEFNEYNLLDLYLSDGDPLVVNCLLETSLSEVFNAYFNNSDLAGKLKGKRLLKASLKLDKDFFIQDLIFKLFEGKSAEEAYYDLIKPPVRQPIIQTVSNLITPPKKPEIKPEVNNPLKPPMPKLPPN